MLTKVFFEDINNGAISIQYIFESLTFLQEETQYQYCIKNSQLCLSHFYSLAKSINRSFDQLMENYKRYQDQQGMKKGQAGFLNQVKKYLIIENLIKFLRHIITKQDQHIKQDLEQSIFMTYVKVKKQLQKPQIAQIIFVNLLRKYQDIQSQLQEIILKYQKKYQNIIKKQLQYKNKNSSRNSIDFLSQQQQKQQQQHQNKLKKAISTLQKPNKQKKMISSQSMIIQDSSTISPLSNSRNKIFNNNRLKPQLSALKDLQQIKKKLQNKRIITQQNQKQKDLIEQKKNLLKNILKQKRYVKFGAKYQKNLEYKYIYEFDTVKRYDNITGFHNIELTNLELDEEDVYVNDINSLMKKYRKIWRFLFFKYSTFGAKRTTQMKSQQKINISQVWKMHRQYKVDFIKKQEVFTIIKIINQNMKRKNDLQNLTYLGFQQYIVQFCILAYNRIGLGCLSPGQKICQLLRKFKQITLQKGGNIQIFQNPQQIYFQQTQVIKEFNKILNDNPNYILPQGYKKINQLQYNYQYKFTPTVKNSFSHQNIKFIHNQSYLNVLQVLDMIIFENQQLNFHIIQPKTLKKDKFIAKPAVFSQLNEKMKNYKNGYMLPKRQINSTYIASRQKVSFGKPQFHPLVEFSLGIKLGIASVPIKNKYIAQQVAYLMDDILDSIQNNSNQVINKSKKKIQNDILKKKKMLLYQLKNQTKQKQKIFKQRSKSVKMQFQKIKNIRIEEKKKKIQQIKQQKLQQKRKEEEQIKKKIKQFQKAKQYFTAKQQKQKQRIIRERQQEKKQKQQYKKNVQDYFKKKKQQLQERQLNIKRDKEYEKKKLQEQKQKRKNLQKKVYLSVLKKDQSTLSRIQVVKLKYNEFCNQKFIEEQFQLHRKSLKILFDLLIKHQKSKISTLIQQNQISQNTFNFFTIKFKIVPFLLEKNIILKIFKSIGKQVDNKFSSGLNYKGFQQALLKIIIKSKNLLNDLIENKKKYHKLKNQSSSSEKELENISSSLIESNLLLRNQSQLLGLQNSKLTNNLNRIQIINQNLSQEYLFDPENVTKETIRQFMLFLNLPDDKISLEQRYRQAVENKNAQPVKLIKKELLEEIIKK